MVVSGLASAIWAQPAAAIPGFPINDVFDVPPSSAYQVDPFWAAFPEPVPADDNAQPGTYTSDGWLRLMDNHQNERINLVHGESFSATTGFVADFDYRLTGGSDEGTGDGFSFYLVDGQAQPGPGGAGYGLGYSLSDQPADNTPGVDGGVVGVGFDAFGNWALGGLANHDFSYDPDCVQKFPGVGDDPTDKRPDAVGVRGPGSGACSATTGTYAPVPDSLVTKPGEISLITGPTGSDYDPSKFEDSLYRHVQIAVLPADPDDADSVPSFTLYMSGLSEKGSAHGPLAEIYTVPLTGIEIPHTLKLGFGASTGWATSYVDVRNISISALTETSISGAWSDTSDEIPEFAPGETMKFTLSAVNLGPSVISQSDETQSNAGWPLMMADLAGLPVEDLQTTVVGSGPRAPVVLAGAFDAKAFAQNVVGANWWSMISQDQAATLTVQAKVKPGTPAGTYTLSYYIPTYFEGQYPTYDPEIDYVTPEMGLSNPYNKDMSGTLSFKVPADPKMEWLPSPTAELTSGDSAVAGSEVTFTFGFKNVGNIEIDVDAAKESFALHAPTSLSAITCSSSVAIDGTGTCSATYRLTQEDAERGFVLLSLSGVANGGGNSADGGASPLAKLEWEPAPKPGKPTPEGGDAGGLAETGSNVGPLVAASLALFAAGASTLGVMSSRRKKAALAAQ